MTLEDLAEHVMRLDRRIEDLEGAHRRMIVRTEEITERLTGHLAAVHQALREQLGEMRLLLRLRDGDPDRSG